MKIAIASGKGGTGKTTLATNLASYLAEKRKIILVDLDVEEPNLGLFLNTDTVQTQDMFKMIPEHHIDTCSYCGLCQDVCNFGAIIQLGKHFMFFPELCHSCYACSELCPTGSRPMVTKKMGELHHSKVQNLTFIESQLDVGQEQAVPLISQTNTYVDESFPDDIIKIYDSPPGTSCPVIEATKDVDLVILITEPTPFGLHDLTLAVDTLREIKKRFVVVINKFGIGNDDVIAYCKEQNISIIAKLPNDRKIAELYSSGKLIYKHSVKFKNELINIEQFIASYSAGAKQ